MFDDTIIPVHNMVSSEWEKNAVIRSAYDHAREVIIPQLICLLEKYVGDGVWVVSTNLFFHNEHINELWTKPDYVTVHDAPSPVTANDESDFNLLANLQGTASSTQLYLGKGKKRIQNNISSAATRKQKLQKGAPEKCLLRHEFSKGAHWFMVYKLRRRHQKEITKQQLSSVSSSSSLSSNNNAPLPSAVLDALTRSALLKPHHQASKNDGGITGSAFQINNTENKTKESETTVAVAIETSFAKDQPLQIEMLQKELDNTITDALSIVRAAHNLEIGDVPKTTVVRWKAEHEFEIRFFE